MKITDLLDPRSISLERKAVGCRGISQAGLCERRREHDRYRRGDCNSSWKM